MNDSEPSVNKLNKYPLVKRAEIYDACGANWNSSMGVLLESREFIWIIAIDQVFKFTLWSGCKWRDTRKSAHTFTRGQFYVNLYWNKKGPGLFVITQTPLCEEELDKCLTSSGTYLPESSEFSRPVLENHLLIINQMAGWESRVKNSQPYKKYLNINGFRVNHPNQFT